MFTAFIILSDASSPSANNDPCSEDMRLRKAKEGWTFWWFKPSGSFSYVFGLHERDCDPTELFLCQTKSSDRLICLNVDQALDFYTMRAKVMERDPGPLYVQAMGVVAIQDCHRPYLQCSTRPCSISISRAANSSLQSPLTHTLRCGVATAIRLLFPPPFPIA